MGRREDRQEKRAARRKRRQDTRAKLSDAAVQKIGDRGGAMPPEVSDRFKKLQSKEGNIRRQVDTGEGRADAGRGGPKPPVQNLPPEGQVNPNIEPQPVIQPQPGPVVAPGVQPGPGMIGPPAQIQPGIQPQPVVDSGGQQIQPGIQPQPGVMPGGGQIQPQPVQWQVDPATGAMVQVAQPQQIDAYGRPIAPQPQPGMIGPPQQWPPQIQPGGVPVTPGVNPGPGLVGPPQQFVEGGGQQYEAPGVYQGRLPQPGGPRPTVRPDGSFGYR
jgi:hypothetical protein